MDLAASVCQGVRLLSAYMPSQRLSSETALFRWGYIWHGKKRMASFMTVLHVDEQTIKNIFFLVWDRCYVVQYFFCH